MKIYAFLLSAAMFVPAFATELKIAGIFGDNMVLQQQSDVPLWGTAAPGETVTVTPSWNGCGYTAQAGADGRWRVVIPTPAAGGPFSIAVNDTTLNDVYSGEVWLASGQSNMAMSLKECYRSTDAILDASQRKIHYINVPPKGTYRPLDDIGADWVVGAPGNAGMSSAVAWYFADFIQKHLGVPVGIINASFGGSIVETWMNEATARTFPGISVPRPADGDTGWTANIATTMYNGMLHPIVGYKVRGVIWYQGESNVFNLNDYESRFPAMVRQWRGEWNDEFPFYYVQVAPFDYTTWNVPDDEHTHVGAWMRDIQRRCLDLIPRSGMAVITDVGEREQIHPKRKAVVGERLGLMALADVYGFKGFESRSPTLDYAEADGDRVIIHFKDICYGLTSFGNDITQVELADGSGVYHIATAWVDEERGVVVAQSKYVRQPVSVRYAFRDYAEPEIFSLSGLPVSSFQTKITKQ